MPTSSSAPSPRRVSRDRHGRGARGPVLPFDVPRYRTRAQLFDAAVLEAYAPLQQRFAEELAHLDIAVDTIPRMRLHSDASMFSPDIVADGCVPLGRVIPAGVDSSGHPTRARLVVFRMPVEQRSQTVLERQELLLMVLIPLVAYFLNLSPTDIDPSWDSRNL